jgi:murein L,D-transpeptidase YcbB/YkuD
MWKRFLLSVLATVTLSVLDITAVDASIRARIEPLGRTALTIEGRRIIATRSLAELYAMNDYRPYWDELRLNSLLTAIESLHDDGLEPEDYHYSALRALIERGNPDAATREALDILASDAYALALYHLARGKVDPVSLNPHWNFAARDIRGLESTTFIRDAIVSNRILSSLEEIRPQYWLYAAGRDALAEYRGIAALGGWPAIPSGPTLKLGMSDARVAVLRRRLAVTGELAAHLDNADRNFDTAVEQALQRAQRRHRLQPDGVLGTQTLRALNVPVQARIDQLRVNLERGRQVLHEITNDDLVVIDIAGFEVHWVSRGRKSWITRAVVGQPFRETPSFKSKIDQIVLNPDWTVPPGILAKDILPPLQRGDLGVLERKNLTLLDRNGRVVDPRSVNFRVLTARSFPFVLRQAPGPDNALGVVKLAFPNQHLVYLHDTPSKSLFDETVRTFSSGCIRTERALELAERVINDATRWSRQALDLAIATGETRTINVRRPIPVLLIYWTADRDEDGSIVFKADPYQRDKRELVALNQTFRAGKRPPP